MTNELFEDVYLPRYSSTIRWLAKKLSKVDVDLFNDLCQVGRITLWRLDPGRATSNEDAWIRQALFNRMREVIRKAQPRRYESLHGHLQRGDQIRLDPDTGEPCLIRAHHGPRRMLGDFGGPDDEER